MGLDGLCGPALPATPNNTPNTVVMRSGAGNFNITTINGQQPTGAIVETQTDTGSGLTFTNPAADVYYGIVQNGVTSGTITLPTPSGNRSATLVIDNEANVDAYAFGGPFSGGLGSGQAASQTIINDGGGWGQLQTLYLLSDGIQIYSDGSGNLHAVSYALPTGFTLTDDGSGGAIAGGNLYVPDPNYIHLGGTLIDGPSGSFRVTNNETSQVNFIVGPDGSLHAPNLPTSDPHEVGTIWNNLGILTVSSG